MPRSEPTVTELPSELGDADAEGPALPFEYVDPTTGTVYFYECLEDADCIDGRLGLCTLTTLDTSVTGDPFLNVTTTCSYGCSDDWQCGEGYLCECGALHGTCVPATCATNDDCRGELCARYEFDSGCSVDIGYSCTTPDDECAVAGDCDGDQCADFGDGYRVCSGARCDVGRPFLIDGEARVAEVAPRADWLLGSAEGRDSALSPSARAALSDAWRDVALMEHASIAAFARFALELLALGAPPELLEATQRAMADETLHARLAFTLATRFGGSAQGPRPLDVGHCLVGTDLRSIVLTTVREGCVGETVAALEASFALADATDPEVRRVLTRIAEDERKHAELAWRFVDWTLSAHPELARDVSSVVAQEQRRADLAARSSEPSEDALTQTLATFGILSGPRRAALRAEVLRTVVAPCTKALTARGRSRRTPGSPVARSSERDDALVLAS